MKKLFRRLRAAGAVLAATAIGGCGSSGELESRDREIAELKRELAELKSGSAGVGEAALRKEIAKLKELAEVNGMDAQMMRNRLAALENSPKPEGVNPLKPYDVPAKPREDWEFVGFSVPEETLETMMWGMRQGDFDVAMQARLDGHQEARELSPAEREASRQSFLAAGAAAREYKLIWKNEVLPEVVYVKVYVEGWGERPQVMGFRHTGSSWKIFGDSFESEP